MKSREQIELDNRVWKIVDECRDAVLITRGNGGFARARTMNKLQDKDKSGGIMWFATEKKSRKIKEIQKDPKVTVFFSHPASFDYVCVFGKAEILTDNGTKHRFWNDSWVKYWKDGPDSGDYVILKVVPERGEFFFNAEVQSGNIDFKPK